MTLFVSAVAFCEPFLEFTLNDAGLDARLGYLPPAKN